MKYLTYKNFITFIRSSLLKVRYFNKIDFIGWKQKIGRHVQIIFEGKSKLFINDKVELSDYCVLKCCGGEILIGSHVYFNSNCRLVAMKRIKIGNDCRFGPNVSIYDHNHKYDDSSILIRDQGYLVETVDVGNDVWIGANCVITAGTSIGNHVIIGANSVVTSNLKSNALYAGSPAKVIKKLAARP